MAMRIFGRQDLEELVGYTSGPCVSIALPTHRPGTTAEADRIRLKNLIREAEDALAAVGTRGEAARRLLEPAERLVQDDLVWQRQQGGVALFLAPSFDRSYRVPLPLDERVVVGQRFYLKPLVPLLTGDGRFFVLALSQHGVRLFQATRHSIAEVVLDGVPSRLEEVVKGEVFDRQLHIHARVPAGKGTHSTVFHGHGFYDDDAKARIRRYFQQVEKGVHRVLRDEHAPLVLAGVDYLLPLYREVSGYPHLLDGGISGNPESLKPSELRDQAWQIVAPRLAARQREAAERYRHLAGTGRTSADLAETVQAAAQGRVDQLFVATGTEQWGRFDPATGRVELHPSAEPGDVDLIDEAIVRTLLTRGTVFAVDRTRVPSGGPVAAVFRY
jgi:hypothetical protein